MIGLVLVTYACWPGKLFDSVAEFDEPLLWSVHHHGSDDAFADRIAGLGERSNVRVHMHRENRGLSRSWNEGMKELYEAGARRVLVVNDDLHFVPGGLERFMRFADDAGDFGLAFTAGLELSASPYAGEVRDQDFACCIIPETTISRIGYFDENITPAYYEDLDYHRRCALAGLPVVITDRVNVEHDRSFTIQSGDEIKQSAMTAMGRNFTYYHRKWGPPGQEIFLSPFGQERYSFVIPWEGRARPYPEEDW